MYINSQVNSFLDSIPDADGSATIEEQRAGFSQLWRTLAPDVSEDVERKEIHFQGEAGIVPALLYKPKRVQGPLPTLLFLHGGGCVTLRPEDFDATSQMLSASAECNVVVPAYRQAPENPFPAPLEDCVSVYRGLLHGHPEIGGDGAIFVAGDSAGGYLVAALCIEARDVGLRQPELQILMYPMLDMAAKTPSRVSRDYFINDKALAGVIQLHCGDQVLDPRASPLRADSLRNLARAIVMTTSLDPLEDEALAFVERLRAAGNDTSHFCYEGQVHGFFSFGAVIDEGNEAVEHVAGLIRAATRRLKLRSMK